MKVDISHVRISFVSPYHALDHPSFVVNRRLTPISSDPLLPPRKSPSLLCKNRVCGCPVFTTVQNTARCAEVRVRDCQGPESGERAPVQHPLGAVEGEERRRVPGPSRQMGGHPRPLHQDQEKAEASHCAHLECLVEVRSEGVDKSSQRLGVTMFVCFSNPQRCFS